MQLLNKNIGKRYKLVEKLGATPFYEVYKAVHYLNATIVCIKIQKKSIGESRLLNQVKIIRQIQGEDLTTDLGITSIFEYANEGSYNYMVMQFLGSSLEQLRTEKEGKLSLSFCLQIGEQMIDRVQTLHEKSFVHRDLKPEHFLYGRSKNPTRVYLSGLGLCRKYLKTDKRHVEYRDTKQSFSGTARYLSVNSHLGIQQSRRDDMQSLLYIFIFLIKGSLPWQNVKGRDKIDKFDKIFDKKLACEIEDLCAGIPEIFMEMLRYVRSMQYEDAPNYEYLKKSLRQAQASNLIFQE